MVATLILLLGWRETYLAVGVATALSIPLILWLVREHPPGDESVAAPDSTGGSAVTLRAAAGTFSFWALIGGFFACGFTDQFVAIHLVPFAEDEEISSIAAANSFAVLSAAGVLGSIALGWTSDAFGRKHALALVYGLRVLSFPLLMVVANNGNLVLLYIFALVFGLTFIANMAPTAGIIRGRYGVASTGTIMGWLLLTHQLGGAAGTYLGGLLHGMNGSYTLTFVLMAAVALAGTVLSLFIKEQTGA